MNVFQIYSQTMKKNDSENLKNTRHVIIRHRERRNYAKHSAHV